MIHAKFLLPTNVWTRRLGRSLGYFQNIKVRRIIPEDPLLSLPPLSITPPDFVPTAKLTTERMKDLNIEADGFLWPEEVKLFKNILMLNERSLAFHQSE